MDTFKEKVKICAEKELLCHRYLYYWADKPVIPDFTYDILEKSCREIGVNIAEMGDGMVGFDFDHPYAKEVEEFFEKYPKADQWMIQAYFWKELYPEHWDFFVGKMK